MSAETILKMIETVDPSDTDTLTKIDAMVLLYVKPEETPLNYYIGQKEQDPEGKAIAHMCHFKDRPKFTRSRDALKAIRPKGWFGSIRIYTKESVCNFVKHEPFGVADSPHLPTEELAELHAIISAIAYERTQTPEGK